MDHFPPNSGSGTLGHRPPANQKALGLLPRKTCRVSWCSVPSEATRVPLGYEALTYTMSFMSPSAGNVTISYGIKISVEHVTTINLINIKKKNQSVKKKKSL